MAWNYYDVGIGNVGSYQVSGHPWVTSSAISSGSTHSISFPFVCKSFTVFNTGSINLKVHFDNDPAAKSTHYETIRNTGSLVEGYKFDTKCSNFYITNDEPATNGGYQVLAELTRIDSVRMFALTGSGIDQNALYQYPVLYYTFEEGTGTTTANQATNGSTIAGTLTNSPSWSTTKLHGTYSVLLDGVDDYVQAASHVDVAFQAGSDLFSVSMWVSSSWDDATSTLLHIGDGPFNTGGGTTGYALRATNDVIDWIRWDGVVTSAKTQNVDYPRATLAGTTGFRHIVGVYTSASLKLYLDGELKGHTTYPNDGNGTMAAANSYPNGLPLRIGTTTTDYFGGYFDEVALFPFVLDQSDITYLYNAGSGRDNNAVKPK